jgi:hypothetical protein
MANVKEMESEQLNEMTSDYDCLNKNIITFVLVFLFVANYFYSSCLKAQ